MYAFFREPTPQGDKAPKAPFLDEIEPPKIDPSIYRWRYSQLLKAGYETIFAKLIASERNIDLHLACELPARGCCHETAVKILL